MYIYFSNIIQQENFVTRLMKILILGVGAPVSLSSQCNCNIYNSVFLKVNILPLFHHSWDILLSTSLAYNCVPVSQIEYHEKIYMSM